MALLETTGLDWKVIFTIVSAVLFAFSCIYAWKIPQGKRFGWVSLLVFVLIAGSLWITAPVVRTVLLDAAGLVLAGYVWSQNSRAGKLFLAATVMGSVLVAAGMIMGGLFGSEVVQPEGTALRMVIGLILLGFAFKLALIPFSFWLAPMAESSSSMTAVLVISILDMAEFGELATLRAEAPWIFSEIQWVWIALALISMFGGALLALGQTNLKRMLAFSTIDDIGYLILGLAVGTAGGILGALIGALSHALSKFLLFGAVGVAESDLKHPVTLEDRGMASRRPVAAAAFIAGSLGMIGIPPMMGFLGRWRLYLGGVEAGGVWLGLAMAAATVLALLYYVRAIHRVWLGKPVEIVASQEKNLTWVMILLVVVVVIMLAVGLFPSVIPGMGGR